MKYIEKEYQYLIEQMKSAHDYVVGDLKAHINWLEKKVADKDELAEQIDEYENFKSDCAACDVVISELREENAKLKEEIASLKKTTVKAKAPRKRARKQVLCTCMDCKTYFYAQRRDAKRCPECKRKRNNQAKYAWLKKQRATK